MEWLRCNKRPWLDIGYYMALERWAKTEFNCIKITPIIAHNVDVNPGIEVYACYFENEEDAIIFKLRHGCE